MKESIRTSVHVLELVTSLDKGGRTVRILDGARHLQNRGFRVTIRSYSPPAPWVSARWPDIKRIEVLKKNKGLDVRSVLSLCELIRTDGIDLIHGHTEDAFLYGGLAARIMRIPAIGTFHRSRPECYEPCKKSKIWNRLLTKQIAVSGYFRKLMLEQTEAPSRKVGVIHGSVDTDRFVMVGEAEKRAIRKSLEIPIEDPVLLSMGHLGSIKGHDITIRSIPLILRRFPSANLYIAGDGSDEEKAKLSRVAAETGIQDRIHFLGQIHNPADWFSACDLFVLAPRQEAFGLVFAEAASAGKPVVATRVGGIPEVVDQNDTGLLVEANDVDGIAGSVIELLNSPARMGKMGINARQRAETYFSNDCLARSYANLFLGLVPPSKANRHIKHCTRWASATKKDDAGDHGPAGMHLSTAAEH